MSFRQRFGAFILCVWAACAHADENIRHHLEAWSAGYPAQVLGVGMVNAERIDELYQARNYQPLWLTQAANNTPGLAARALLQRISTVAEDGLLPADYHWPQLQELQRSDRAVDVAQYELALTDGFISLVDHLLAGKIDPQTLTSEWQANRRKPDVKAVLQQLLSSSDPAAVLEGLLPRHIRYFRLKQAMLALQGPGSEPWLPLATAPLIKPGSNDPRLAEIGRRLHVWGDLQTEVATDLYGRELQQAVQSFQTRHGLDADGVIGAQTIKALNVSPRQRQQQIAVNLERWRWLPADLGNRYMVVNLAAFELKIIENNATVMVKPVIVGRDQRKPPVFSDNIRYLVFNPTWTVPSKLAREDKLPEISRDPGYLQRLGFSVYPSGGTTAIDPASIDWSKYNRRNFPFRLVQAPGPLNALGQVKFMFPNAYDVYLHDTPSRELFKQSHRAFSSGCIRVAEPLQLAEYLLRSAGWNRARIDAVLASGKLETVYLKQPLPIHIEYWTAWVERGGDVHYREDVYQRDAPLWQALQIPRRGDAAVAVKAL